MVTLQQGLLDLASYGRLAPRRDQPGELDRTATGGDELPVGDDDGRRTATGGVEDVVGVDVVVEEGPRRCAVEVALDRSEVPGEERSQLKDRFGDGDGEPAEESRPRLVEPRVDLVGSQQVGEG